LTHVPTRIHFSPHLYCSDPPLFCLVTFIAFFLYKPPHCFSLLYIRSQVHPFSQLKGNLTSPPNRDSTLFQATFLPFHTCFLRICDPKNILKSPFFFHSRVPFYPLFPGSPRPTLKSPLPVPPCCLQTVVPFTTPLPPSFSVSLIVHPSQ